MPHLPQLLTPTSLGHVQGGLPCEITREGVEGGKEGIVTYKVK